MHQRRGIDEEVGEEDASENDESEEDAYKNDESEEDAYKNDESEDDASEYNEEGINRLIEKAARRIYLTKKPRQASGFGPLWRSKKVWEFLDRKGSTKDLI